ncbi:MAG: fluoride efflux transporter CrcB [bacterium]|nr:fluoride efflux transporter CrcB [bacterium]
MLQLLAVGLGGFLGAIARHATITYTRHRFGEAFPFGTLIVNVAGCLVLGSLLGLAMRRDLEESTRLFLAVGLLGSFTTFSTFGHETLVLWSTAGPGRALANVFGHVCLGLAALWLGASFVR